MPYYPLPNKDPWTPRHAWVIATWSDERDQWIVTYGNEDRATAVEKLNAMRAENPEAQWRLVRETNTYTTEED